MAKLNKQAVKKTGRERKEIMVAELTKKIDETTGLVFTDYKGLTHQQLENLKKELKKDDATMIVAKNSLMKLSLGNSKNYKDARDNAAIEGSMATLFIRGDMVEPLRKLQKAAKEAGLPKVKFGVLEGQILDDAAILKIASLPGREVLLTQLAAMLNSPIQGFVTVLNSIPQKFVMTLDAIAKAKPDKSADEVEIKSEDVVQNTEPAAISASPADETPITPTDPTPKPTEATRNEDSTETKEEITDKEESAEQTKNETKTTEDKESALQTEKEDEGGEK